MRCHSKARMFLARSQESNCGSICLNGSKRFIKFSTVGRAEGKDFQQGTNAVWCGAEVQKNK